MYNMYIYIFIYIYIYTYITYITHIQKGLKESYIQPSYLCDAQKWTLGYAKVSSAEDLFGS